ncbi:MAG: macro domain-containing protein [Chloroflexota bacterium]|nr:macro domain-containing protein [Chloroflexota bacterium]
MASRSGIVVRTGDLLESDAQTLVNTVNCVGVMGKGIALDFKRAFPMMFEDYVKRCAAGEVRLGEPYVWRPVDVQRGIPDCAPTGERWVLNFPTKGHWRARSRLSDIADGLDWLEAHCEEWGIESLAVPALGCQNGGLRWDDVRPLLVERLSRLGIPVELYAPR